MSMSFTKLFSSITESTIWSEDMETRLVWITMLAMADRHGRVWASIPGLARRANVSTTGTQAAIEKFLSPDQFSRTPDNDGRRIEIIDGGWRLLNYLKYRSIRDTEAVKESKRKSAQKRRHQGDKENVDTTVDCRCNAEAEAEAEAEERKEKKGEAGKKPTPSVEEDRSRTPHCAAPPALPPGLDTERCRELLGAFIEHRRLMKKPMSRVSLTMTINKLQRWGELKACQALEDSISNGWQGVFEPKGNGAHNKPSTSEQKYFDHTKAIT